MYKRRCKIIILLEPLMNDDFESSQENLVVFVHGLPWTVSKGQILDFFGKTVSVILKS